MKLYAGLLVAAAAAALATPSRGDDSEKFVVRGDATKVIMEQNQINVATAEAISKACVEEAVKQGVRVSIVIYDQFGEPVYMYRMDGQAKVAIETAMMKARTVVNTRQPSKAVMNQVLSGHDQGARPAASAPARHSAHGRAGTVMDRENESVARARRIPSTAL